MKYLPSSQSGGYTLKFGLIVSIKALRSILFFCLIIRAIFSINVYTSEIESVFICTYAVLI